MAERIEAADAPPPPPPPPTPDNGPRDRNPDVTPELSDALGREDQGPDAREPGPAPGGGTDQPRQADPVAASPTDIPAGPAGPDAREQAPDQDLSRPEPEKPDLPRADVSSELRTAMTEPDTQSGPSHTETGTDPVVDEGADPVVDDGTGTGHSSSELDDRSVTDHPDSPDPDSIRITPDRGTHILDGDDTGGGHRSGTGMPGKTEFPADWDDDQILSNVEDVGRNPDVKPDEPQGNGRWLYEGARDGVHTYVVVNPDGTIWTAWPREGDPGVVRNP